MDGHYIDEHRQNINNTVLPNPASGHDFEAKINLISIGSAAATASGPPSKRFIERDARH
jgi:hypothetical protein